MTDIDPRHREFFEKLKGLLVKHKAHICPSDVAEEICVTFENDADYYLCQVSEFGKKSTAITLRVASGILVL